MDHIENLWKVIERSKNENKTVYIGSLDIKGAYDGIEHKTIEKHIDLWQKQGYFSKETTN